MSNCERLAFFSLIRVVISTINQSNEMRLLVLSAINVGSHAYQGVYPDVMDAPLEVEFQIFALVAEELPLINDNTDFFREPARRCPQLLSIWTSVDCCIEHENSRYAVDCLSRR